MLVLVRETYERLEWIPSFANTILKLGLVRVTSEVLVDLNSDSTYEDRFWKQFALCSIFFLFWRLRLIVTGMLTELYCFVFGDMTSRFAKFV